MLEDSRDEPWSQAERALQRRYRGLSLPYRYETNHRVDLPDGTHRLVDLAIPDLLLGFEVDGWAYHSSRSSFDDDRAADASLATLSWQRLRFDADRVLDSGPAVSVTMAAIVAARETLLLGTRPAGGRVRRPHR